MLNEEDDPWEDVPSLPSFADNLKTISRALNNRRQVYLSQIWPFANSSLLPLSEKAQTYLQDDPLHYTSYTVNPINIFRNSDDKPCLLFHCRILEELMIGVVAIDHFIDVDECDTPIQLDSEAMTIVSKIDLAEFKDAKDYRKGQKEKACLVTTTNSEMITFWLDDYCTNITKITVNGQDVWRIRYRVKDQDELLGLLMDLADQITLYPGHGVSGTDDELFDVAMERYEKMKKGYDRYLIPTGHE